MENNEKKYFENEQVSALNETLNHTNYWLQWAELKHAAFLAVNVAALFGWGSLLDYDFWENSSCTIFYFSIVSVVFLALAILPSIIAFLPNTKSGGDKTNNLLFFGQNSSRNPKELLVAFKENADFSRMFAEEITINAKIAEKKYRLFRWTVGFSMAAYLSFSLTVISVLVNW